jgi:hypothetical protein
LELFEGWQVTAPNNEEIIFFGQNSEPIQVAREPNFNATVCIGIGTCGKQTMKTREI